MLLHGTKGKFGPCLLYNKGGGTAWLLCMPIIKFGIIVSNIKF